MPLTQGPHGAHLDVQALTDGLGDIVRRGFKAPLLGASAAHVPIRQRDLAGSLDTVTHVLSHPGCRAATRISLFSKWSLRVCTSVAPRRIPSSSERTR